MRTPYKAALAVSDQLCTVGANFIYGIMLARILPVADFGVFAILYALLVLIFMVHNAAVTEALCALPPSDAPGRDPEVAIGPVFLYSTILCSPLLVAAGLYAFYIMEGISGEDLLWFASACLASLFFWSGKAVAFQGGKPQTAAIGSALTGVVMLSSLWWLHSRASGVQPFAGISIGAIAGGVLILFMRRNARPVPLRGFHGQIMRYAAWSVPAGVLIWVVNNALYFSLGEFGSVSEVAGFKAVLTILLPVNQGLIGLSMFLLPWLAKIRSTKDDVTVISLAFKLCVAGALVAAFVGVCTAASSEWIMVAIYGEKYRGFAGALCAAAVLLPWLWAAITIIRTLLRSLGDPRAIFYAYGTSLVLAGPVAVLVLSRQGVLGAIFGLFLLQSIIAVALSFSVVRRRKRGDDVGFEV
jgi:O-antigen/teichoic acid export membrane protein